MSGMGGPFGAPNGGGNAMGIAPILVGLLSALGSIPQQQEQKKEQQADLGFKQAQTEALKMQSDPNSPVNQQRTMQMQEAQRAQAQQQWSSLGQRAMANPAWAKSPVVQQQLMALSQQLGFPSPYDDKGNLDEKAFLNPLSSLPVDANGEKAREFILAQPPGDARINAARSAGITLTPAEANAASSFTAKASNDIQRTANQGIHYANADATAATRANSLKVMQDAQAHRFDADADFWRKKADTLQQTVNAQTTNANAHMLEAEASMKRASAAIDRAGRTLRTNQPMAQKFYNSAYEETNRAERAYAAADAAFEQAQGAGADDSILQPLAAKRAAAQGALTSAKSQLSLLSDELAGNSGHAAGIKSQSGASNVTVTTQGGNKGATVVESRVINGVTWQKLSDGTFRQAP